MGLHRVRNVVRGICIEKGCGEIVCVEVVMLNSSSVPVVVRQLWKVNIINQHVETMGSWRQSHPWVLLVTNKTTINLYSIQ